MAITESPFIPLLSAFLASQHFLSMAYLPSALCSESSQYSPNTVFFLFRGGILIQQEYIHLLIYHFPYLTFFLMYCATDPATYPLFVLSV